MHGELMNYYYLLDEKKVRFTKNDLKALMDRCTELSDKQLPACEVTFTESIGEGMIPNHASIYSGKIVTYSC